MIEVQHITKRFGRTTAIHDISFKVEKGEIVAFLGPNGAGKTTTMRILTGYMPATEGTARISGFDCHESPHEVKKRIGYLPEYPPLYLELTVLEYLTFVGRIKGTDLNHLPRQLDQVMDQTGVGDVRYRVIGNLSRGYQQRVGLAQALLHDPPVLILDEPTVGLDPNQIIEIRELIKGLAGSHTILLSTHILPEATALCQRVIIIHQGRIVAEDTPAQLATRFRQSEKLSITIGTPPDDIEDRLRTIPGVVNVCAATSPNTYLVESNLGHDIRKDLARLVVDQGMGLLELKPMTISLEDVFIQLTQHEEAAQTSSAIPTSTISNDP